MIDKKLERNTDGMIETVETEVLRENLTKCQKDHTYRNEIEPGFPQWDPGE